MKQYHTWRAQATTMVSRIHDPDVDVSTTIAKYSHNKFTSVNLTNDGPAFYQEAEAITKLAMEIAKALLIQSKANFRVKAYTMGCVRDLFDNDEMEIHDQVQRSEMMTVDLVLSPALIKHGNSDGEFYDHKEVLVKVQVIC